MDHILNKIDDNLREKVKEITKNGKVHSVKENRITNDNEDERRYKKNSKIFRQSYVVQAEKQEMEVFGDGKHEKYEVEVLEAEKHEKYKVEVFEAEKHEKYEVEAFEAEEKNKKLGRFIDVKE